jgi:diguanylate cyclase (GGDEF)-like protein
MISMAGMFGRLRTVGGEPRHRASGGEESLNQVLDALAAILRSFGRQAFETDDRSSGALEQDCERWAQHVLNGAAVADGAPTNVVLQERSWAGVRQFFHRARKSEQEYVGRSLGDLKSVVRSFMETVAQSFAADATDDAEVARALGRLQQELDAGASAGVVRDRAQRLGEVVREGLRQREARHEETLEQLGARLSQVRSALVEAQTDATTDRLCGVANRAALDNRMGASLAFHAFSAQPESLLLLDLDHFKRVNDEYGHRGGDEVLRQFGALLNRVVVRKTDFIARFGGEEFAVLLDDTDQIGALVVAKRILKAVRHLVVAFDGREIRVTVSIGLAAVRSGDTRETWLEEADRALYRAKRTGRDRIGIRART